MPGRLAGQFIGHIRVNYFLGANFRLFVPSPRGAPLALHPAVGFPLRSGAHHRCRFIEATPRFRSDVGSVIFFKRFDKPRSK
jgi:hypothetical protein